MQKNAVGRSCSTGRLKQVLRHKIGTRALFLIGLCTTAKRDIAANNDKKGQTPKGKGVEWNYGSHFRPADERTSTEMQEREEEGKQWAGSEGHLPTKVCDEEMKRWREGVIEDIAQEKRTLSRETEKERDRDREKRYPRCTET